MQTEAHIKEILEEEAKYKAVDRAWIADKNKFEEPYRKLSQTPPDFETTMQRPRPKEPKYIALPEMENEEVGGKMRLKKKKEQLTVLHNGEQASG